MRGFYVYADNELASVTSAHWLVGETGAGLYNDADGSVLMNQRDNFDVLNVP
jgi:hypothetical protein